MSEREWFYAVEGAQSGPVPENELRGVIGSGELGAEDLVWAEGMAEWSAIGDLPELSSALKPRTIEAGPPDLPPLPAAPSTQEGGQVTSSLAVVSLVLGILSYPLSCAYGIGLLLAIAAIVTGIMGCAEIRREPDRFTGMGLANAGIILACVYFVLVIVGFVVMVIFFSMADFR